MKEKLAIFGGEKTIQKPLKPYTCLGPEEKRAVMEVMDSGVLSKFIGGWNPDFFGGPKVQEFEKNWTTFFKTKYAVSVNSNTSGLIAALGALDLEPGDQVLVTPWSICATATSILMWNAIPVFVDIEPDTFGIDPTKLENAINSRTKAIVVVNIFGQAAKLTEIIKIAKKHGLKIIEDNAQAPGSLHGDAYTGTIGDIGVFSLNYHKHIHTGEGGICVTDDPSLAERMQLIRNHGEAVVKGKGVSAIHNIIGFNFRMPEMEAAIGIEQLKKLKGIAARRSEVGTRLSLGLKGLSGLQTPVVYKENTHVYYTYPLVLDENALGLKREAILKALEAEGVPALQRGYVNIHRLPIFERKIAYGKNGFPWTTYDKENKIRYGIGTCPVAETLQDQNFFNLYACGYEFSNEEIDQVCAAFQKVWSNLDLLKGQE